ncbi:MAG: Pterin binding enzyme [Euryarchaeota archaeon ADurb.Bin190]|nr:MAG: Pterin binding enzyme [Euryarchaeota archaeon ADurb.Bin190]
MKILLVTGRLAEDQVRAFAGEADVLVADTDVAAFITPQMLFQAAPHGYDLILIPGAVTADFREAEKALGSPIRLGPKHAADLGEVLRLIEKEELELSRTIPACQLLLGEMRERALRDIEMLEAQAEAFLQICRVKIGGSSRMKVLAEVVDATRLPPGELAGRIRYYQEEGADMIDLGLPLDARPEEVRAALAVAKKATDLPVSIDSVRPDLLLTGLEAGADMLLSLNAANMAQVGQAAADLAVPAVVIPGPGPASLEENVNAALDLGVRVIADPVLDPPMQGLAVSLHRYIQFCRRHPGVPLFFGAGNVTELLDADTHGVNALLAATGAEVGAAILFTPEYSAKAAGSVRELATASRMMQLSGKRKTPPKDLGLDLLRLKQKRRLPVEPLPQAVKEAQPGHVYVLDDQGPFRIFLSQGLIVARNGPVSICGRNARDLVNSLVDLGLVGRLDHAAYLGRELQKAETALRLGRDYVQDEPLWPADKS